MSFDAGAITGSLELNYGPLKDAMQEVVGLANAFPASFDRPMKEASESAKTAGSAIVSVFQGSMHVVAEIFRSAVHVIGHELIEGIGAAGGEAMEGLASAGVSALDALVSVGKGIVAAFARCWDEVRKSAHEAFESIVRSAATMVRTIKASVSQVGHELEEVFTGALQAGVSPEFFSKSAAAFEAAGSSTQGFSDALKFLNRNTAEAAQGNQELVEAFGKIGISAEFLRANLGNTEAVFKATADGIAGLRTSAEKTQAAMALLGRGGAEALGAFAEGSRGIEEFGEKFAAVGGVVSEHQAMLGERFKQMETLVKGAWNGITRAFAQPFLEYVNEHFDELVKLIAETAQLIRNNLTGAMEELKPHFGEIIKAITDGLVLMSKLVVPLVEFFADLLIIINKVADAIGWIAERMSGFSKLGDFFAGATGLTPEQGYALAGRAPKNGGGGQAGGQGLAVNVGDIHVHTVQGASHEEIAKNVAEVAEKKIRAALYREDHKRRVVAGSLGGDF